MVLTVHALVNASGRQGRSSAPAQQRSILPARTSAPKRFEHIAVISGEKSTPTMRPRGISGIMRLIRSPPPKPTSSTWSSGVSCSTFTVRSFMGAFTRLRIRAMILPLSPDGFRSWLARNLLTPTPISAIHDDRLPSSTQVPERRAAEHEPYRQRGDEVEIEAQHHEIECAVDRTVQRPEGHENPCRPHIRGVDVARDEEIEREGIEEHRNLEQVFQVVRGIGDRRR